MYFLMIDNDIYVRVLERTKTWQKATTNWESHRNTDIWLLNIIYLLESDIHQDA